MGKPWSSRLSTVSQYEVLRVGFSQIDTGTRLGIYGGVLPSMQEDAASKWDQLFGE
jgi:hypothetical protein